MRWFLLAIRRLSLLVPGSRPASNAGLESLYRDLQNRALAGDLVACEMLRGMRRIPRAEVERLLREGRAER